MLLSNLNHCTRLIRSAINRFSGSMATVAKRVKVEDNGEDVLDKEELDEVGEESQEDLPSVSESSVGITEFITNHRGFSGLIKQRYSDFIVHEISESDGQEVRLTNIDLPDDNDKNTEQDQLPSLTSLIGEENENRIKEFDKNGKFKEKIELDINSLDKEQRTVLHQAIKKAFPLLNTNTAQKNDIRYLEVMKGTDKRTDKRKKWPYDGDFTHFTVYMENRGTFDVVNSLSRLYNCPRRRFGYAGTKDKRAIATQRFSLYRIPPERILRANDFFANNNSHPIMVGNISFGKENLKLGELKGNRFDLVIRDVQYTDRTDIDQGFHSIKTNGFINYFGTQRFGAGSVKTQETGVAILRENWAEAIDTICAPKLRDFSPRSGSHLSHNEVMKLWHETKDASKCFSKYFWKNSNEGLIFKHLSQHPNDYYNALNWLPRNSRTFYVHAYQSLIWNKVASERIRRHGLKVLPGDLVVLEDESKENDNNDKTACVADENDEHADFFRLKPVYVNETNIEKATIFDVVLPLCGCQIKLPQNDTGEHMTELIKADGIDLGKFEKRAKAFNFFGAYRKLICKPFELDYEVLNYDDEKIRLVPTDYDILNKIELERNAGGSKTAIKLNISLPASSYATVFIRELFHQDVAGNWKKK